MSTSQCRNLLSKIILSVICSLLIIGSVCPVIYAENNIFTDVDNGLWYSESIHWAYSNGYAKGTSGSTFSPNAEIRRCDFAVMLARFDGIDKSDYAGASEFADVENDSYYNGAVNWAHAYGIVSGTAEKRFSPEKALTREEASVILERYLDYCGCDVYSAKYARNFTDRDKISEWAKDSVEFVGKTGLMSGVGSAFAPKNNLTRAEAVTILFALDKAKKKQFAEDTVDVGSDRQILVEDYTIDSDSTTAQLCYVAPVKKEAVFNFDAEYEYKGVVYHNIVKAPDGKYRMYYKATDVYSKRRICYLESSDGITWTRPTNGYTYRNRVSNIVTDGVSYSPDNLFVFYDTNPNCKGTRWKGIYGQWGDGLFCEYSPDGLSFFCNGEEQIYADPVSNGGMFFDTLNTMYYDELRGKYVAFVRGLHEGDNYVLTPEYIESENEKSVRDIRYVESTDFVNWSEPVALTYDDAGDWEMYANAIQPYYRAKQLYIGLPTRLHMLGKGKYETSVYLMSSRSLTDWDITAEPYITPESGTTYEYPKGGFACVGIIQTSESEMSLYMAEPYENSGRQAMYRYTLRIDGFRCAKAESTAVLETEWLDFDGSSLELNFRTEKSGYIKVTVTDTNGKSITSAKLSGDKISQNIFTKGELSSLCQGAVKLTFEMNGAEIYSYKFGD